MSTILPKSCAHSVHCLETERTIAPGDVRLLSDPFAFTQAGPQAMNHIHEKAINPMYIKTIQSMALRSRFFDDSIVESVAKNVKQVVILGVDARAFCLEGLAKDNTLWEIDTLDFMNYKDSMLSEHFPSMKPLCTRYVIASRLI